MELFGAILSIAIALTLGAMTPGPSFLMVARTAVAVSRRDGLAAAGGMGAGGALFSVLALVGLLAILAAIPVLYVVLKLSGGTYLVYLAYRIWRSADQPLVADNAPVPSCVAHPWKSFWLGLATQASNPKTALVYASVFASLLPAKVPSFVPVVLPVLIQHRDHLVLGGGDHAVCAGAARPLRRVQGMARSVSWSHHGPAWHKAHR